MKSILSVKQCDKVNLRWRCKEAQSEICCIGAGCQVGCSSPFDSDRLNVAQNTFKVWETVKNVRGFLSCVLLHMCDLVCLLSKLSLWSHGTNLTDKKKKGGEGAPRGDCL